MPRGEIGIAPLATDARMSIESIFPSAEAMEQVLAMGLEEGLDQAVGQIDAILAETPVAPRVGVRRPHGPPRVASRCPAPR